MGTRVARLRENSRKTCGSTHGENWKNFQVLGGKLDGNPHSRV